jgi:hypothetical protein
MSNSSGSQKRSFLDILFSLFGKPKPSGRTIAAAQPVIPPDNTTEPLCIVISRVLLVIYDPIADTASGRTLSQAMNWNRPDDLANAFIQEILTASSGLARYQIVQRVKLTEFPAKIDGYRYDPQTYLAVMNGSQQSHQPDGVDYKAILTGLNVLPHITSHDIDEVWLFGLPHAGFYESTMGGAGAFWCNSQPLTWTSGCNRRFVVMGFSNERGVGEMLESFGHRTESILQMTFSKTTGQANLYRRFTLYDKESPGQAAVGNIHYAPNSEKEYDWNNPRLVKSSCYDWYNFPNIKDDIREVNADEWGNGDLYAHHQWWLKHLPKATGRTSGVVNNWWQFTMDPNLVNL